MRHRGNEMWVLEARSLAMQSISLLETNIEQEDANDAERTKRPNEAGPEAELTQDQKEAITLYRDGAPASV